MKASLTGPDLKKQKKTSMSPKLSGNKRKEAPVKARFLEEEEDNDDASEAFLQGLTTAERMARRRAISRRSSAKNRKKQKEQFSNLKTSKVQLEQSTGKLMADNEHLRQTILLVKALMQAKGGKTNDTTFSTTAATGATPPTVADITAAVGTAVAAVVAPAVAAAPVPRKRRKKRAAAPLPAAPTVATAVTTAWAQDQARVQGLVANPGQPQVHLRQAPAVPRPTAAAIAPATAPVAVAAPPVAATSAPAPGIGKSPLLSTQTVFSSLQHPVVAAANSGPIVGANASPATHHLYHNEEDLQRLIRSHLVGAADANGTTSHMSPGVRYWLAMEGEKLLHDEKQKLLEDQLRRQHLLVQQVRQDLAGSDQSQLLQILLARAQQQGNSQDVLSAFAASPNLAALSHSMQQQHGTAAPVRPLSPPRRFPTTTTGPAASAETGAAAAAEAHRIQDAILKTIAKLAAVSTQASPRVATMARGLLEETTQHLQTRARTTNTTATSPSSRMASFQSPSSSLGSRHHLSSSTSQTAHELLLMLLEQQHRL